MKQVLSGCLILMIGLGLSAQTVAISGEVTNQSGDGINRAIVRLASKNIEDTTGADGAYTLASEVSSVNNLTIRSGADAISFKCSMVAVHLAQPAPVRMELFDMQGNLLQRVVENYALAGTVLFDAMKHHRAANMMVIRVSIGRRTTLFRFLPFANGYGNVPSSGVVASDDLLAKQLAVSDELEVSAAGYVTKTVPITSYEGTVDVTLEMEEVGECTPSKTASQTVSGSGPHDVVIETNSDPGINKGTIYRPKDLEPGKNYPIFVWGNGGCSQNGLSNKAAMGEIASWGYFVVADGTPDGTGNTMIMGDDMGDPKPFYDYITWAIAENRKPCSAYYQSLDTTKIASDGFSCGGMMSIHAAGDPCFSAMGYSSSGLFSESPTKWKKIHTPFKIMNGGPSDAAYENGQRDYNGISALGIPIIYFVKTSAGHGGDLNNGKGDFNTVNLAWLNWRLKGDEGATGKALLTGPDCKYCKASGWEFKEANWE
ncbi:MAG: hypothetical protein JW863_24155 [Chitinispirillaceae bacterium]|nr:hypothetical protein [Chitinispirillaceae bacterium]